MYLPQLPPPQWASYHCILKWHNNYGYTTKIFFAATKSLVSVITWREKMPSQIWTLGIGQNSTCRSECSNIAVMEMHLRERKVQSISHSRAIQYFNFAGHWASRKARGEVSVLCQTRFDFRDPIVSTFSLRHRNHLDRRSYKDARSNYTAKITTFVGAI